MTNVSRVLCLALAAGVVLAGCNGASSSPPTVTSTVVVTPTPTPGATSGSPTEATASASATADPTLADGRHAVYVTAVNVASRQLTVDVIQFFTGDAAAVAAKEDGADEVPPPNDYWIRNTSKRLRTLPLATDARITVNVLAAEESGSATRDVPVSVAKLAGYSDLTGHVFWLTARSDTISSLAEQFLP